MVFFSDSRLSKVKLSFESLIMYVFDSAFAMLLLFFIQTQKPGLIIIHFYSMKNKLKHFLKNLSEGDKTLMLLVSIFNRYLFNFIDALINFYLTLVSKLDENLYTNPPLYLSMFKFKLGRRLISFLFT